MPMLNKSHLPRKRRWAKPGNIVRYFREKDERHAVFVVEEPEGMRKIHYLGRTYKLFLPWRYFFIMIRWLDAPFIPNDAGVHLLFAERRADSIDDEVLLLPYLPNLFENGGVCLCHSMHYGVETPAQAIAIFLRWFYKSNGNGFFSYSAPEGWRDPFSTLENFGNWQNMGEKASEIKWRKSPYRSIGEALNGLSFNYWHKTDLSWARPGLVIA